MEQGLIHKAFWLLRHRPNQVFRRGREKLLFEWSRLLRPLFFGPSSGVEWGKNVRLQNNFSLSAERPDARIRLGDRTIIYEKAQIEAYGRGEIQIGNSCILGDLRIYARQRILLGDRVLTSWNVLIQDFDSHPINPEERAVQVESICQGSPQRSLAWNFPSAPIEIGDDVWIGAGSTVLKGVRVGPGSIIAAGAVVPRGDYPPRSVLAGNPARVVKTL